MTWTQNVTANQDIVLNNGALVIPKGTKGVQQGHPNRLHPPVTVEVAFDPPYGRQVVPESTVNGPPRLVDLL